MYSSLEYYKEHLDFLLREHSYDAQEIMFARLEILKAAYPQHIKFYDDIIDKLATYCESACEKENDSNAVRCWAAYKWFYKNRDFLAKNGMDNLCNGFNQDDPCFDQFQ